MNMIRNESKRLNKMYYLKIFVKNEEHKKWYLYNIEIFFDKDRLLESTHFYDNAKFLKFKYEIKTYKLIKIK